MINGYFFGDNNLVLRRLFLLRIIHPWVFETGPFMSFLRVQLVNFNTLYKFVL